VEGADNISEQCSAHEVRHCAMVASSEEPFSNVMNGSVGGDKEGAGAEWWVEGSQHRI
jgi:hypothetical protein